MKKYYSIAFLLLSMCVFAQQAISFESTEGFSVGDINGQAGWISTPTGGFPENVTHQMISTDKASDGSSALKIVKENTYGTQTDPVIGGFYNLSAPLANTNFSVSFDINISQLNGSDFGFQAINSIDDQFVVRLDFEKTGLVKILNLASSIQELISTPSTWLPNTWYRLKVVGSATEIRYYLNNVLIYTGAATSSLNINQLRFVHNNSVGSAYIDNIKINSELWVMSVKDSKATSKEISLYPNPATDFLTVNSAAKVKSIQLYDETGKLIKTEVNNNKIEVKGLSEGVYMVNIKTEARNFTEKVIIR
ncbi:MULTISPECIES: T9SS type A sorting domain-containing protein [unclassified Chryseobacterium]|uniref:T9SS type A sorting domain-containing protein n=1 Tax=unclassified Chryseobacterium TaxID=2593645 RepID=UPI00285371C3|nr:T9SS type A sorting domain-containing protein [Chryseobacterium sp. CFS7]MDR4894129.1 T9SS type A sorting domain-containing protein [Chryseobacterium sp. CFS7]